MPKQVVVRFAEDIPRMKWAEFLAAWKWRQGEHLIAIGPTGRGKSTVIEAILPKRKRVWVFITKKIDPIIGVYKKHGFVERESVEGLEEEVYPKVLLHPPFDKKKPKTRTQHKEFEFALDRAFDHGGVCVVIEETQYMVERLKLMPELKDLWHQGRSAGVTVVAGTQRPAFIPLIAYSGSTHIFFFQSADMRDLARIGGISGVNNKVVQEAVSMLDWHQMLYVNTVTGEMVITKVAK